jgi:HEAT repeat protein/outer membrane protein assembly factor BamB
MMMSFRCQLAVAFVFLIVGVFVVAPSAGAEPSAGESDEQLLHNAGLSSDGAALTAFFQERARTDVDGEQLRLLLTRFAAEGQAAHAATVELLGLGSLALQALRQSASDLDHPELAARAARCLPWLDGPASHRLLIAAAHVLAERKPEGAAAALLAYLPFADSPEVIAAVNAALVTVAAPSGKADAALLRGLSDRLGIRRAAAVVALCRAVPPAQVPDVRKLLKDPAAIVRLRTALALAEANDAEAIPVLIDLLAELAAEKRQPIEECLTQLAGEWAPMIQFATDDAISRGIRRDAWASWWRRTDGPLLIAALGKHTLTPDKRRKMQGLLAQLGSDEFTVREDASRQLSAFGRIALPSLRAASKDRDAEVARRAKLLIERLENGPDVRLPLAALRLLALRKPVGAVEALLAYLPFVEDEVREEEVHKSLTVLARRDGKLDAALRHALADPQEKVRAVVAEALIQGGDVEGRAAVRKLLAEDVPSVRLRLALALTDVGEREGIAVLIELLPLLSEELFVQGEDALYQLAGESAPKMPEGADSADKKKHREAWAAWWKFNAKRVELGRVTVRPTLGYTLICDENSVQELDRHGKTLWKIDNAGSPIDTWMLPGNRVLIAEWGTNRVTERDRKGTVLWEKTGLNAPANAQRLPNGNTFIALKDGAMMEVDRAGKEIYRIANIPNVTAGYRSRQGAIICVSNNQCLFLTTAGKQLKSFPLKYPGTHVGCLDVLPDGRILIASNSAGKVMEYNRQGKLLCEWDVPNVTTPTGLPNGHILVSSQGGNRVAELDRKGKVIWERTNIPSPYRARRR